MGLKNTGVYSINVNVQMLPETVTEIRRTAKAYLLNIRVRLWIEDRTKEPVEKDMEVWFPEYAVGFHGRTWYVESKFLEKKEMEIATKEKAKLVQIVVTGASVIRVPGAPSMRRFR